MKWHFCAVWRQAEKSKILVGRIRVKMEAFSQSHAYQQTTSTVFINCTKSSLLREKVVIFEGIQTWVFMDSVHENLQFGILTRGPMVEQI